MNNAEIVILANSVKHHQHCVAGKCTATGQWVRPVSNTNGAELSHAQAQCQNPHGTFNVKPLQKVLMGFSAHVPLAHQPENYVIDGSMWRQNYRISDGELNQYLDQPDDIWGNADRVPHALILSGQIVVGQSLYLMAVDNLNLYRNQYNRRRASFLYRGTNYDLAVTDPSFDRITQNNEAVKGILCVSLGEEYQGDCFKLVATVF
ncbi:dual OB domain-containing protein [Chromohalobacter canadensis]|uniref:Dual OB-containing domain-containing protein n=1 Tax=Chromohalobacter canadensis TaxID=141389 RepID=A0ABZ0YDP6_9GAMM|nr:hypothetical protein [Chromohalobacter canadensis]MCK0769986.1 hypothetical protein [Chromohalobacter canadensis]WQH09572.1 hypothetical protein SR908_02615 [Chromohalobacter canadensis]